MSKRSADPDEFADIRESVRALCAKFPGEYWRALDRERAYPTDFVKALTEAGYLAALIPEEFGGSGLGISAAAAILEEVHASGCNGAACHAQMYTMGTILRHGNAEQKRDLSAQDRQRRIAPAGLRRHRADLGHRHAVVAHHGAARGQRSLRHQRPETLDLARRAFRPDAAAGAHRAEGEGQEAHRRPVGVPGRHAAGAKHQHHHQSDPHHDEPRHHAGVLRRLARAGGKSDRRGRPGLPLHPGRHERRAHPDRGGMHRRCQMVHRQGDAAMPRSANCSAGRSARTRACSSRSRAPMRRCAPPN